ncbi:MULTISPECIES: hypothetical protein [Bacillaceae]|uniref:Uncharacterized protein n=1 Tax=Domibacillus aminovorans TaxID=29332 RepID=A0A177KL22_9BACI|nr:MULTISPECIES: hypothetical protein [Bacillaceae]OAH53281.1 hypothetical protein AWH48_13110 [Domibacillus aminovorans]
MNPSEKIKCDLSSSVETIRNILSSRPFDYKDVHFVEEEFLPGEGKDYIGFIYDVKGKCKNYGDYKNYEVSVFSRDGLQFEVRKDSDQGFDDLEDRFTL